MIRTLIERNFNVIFSGSTGTAKTASINGMLLGGFNPDKYCVISFAFSAQTTENQCADIIDGKLDKLCYPAEKGVPARARFRAHCSTSWLVCAF